MIRPFQIATQHLPQQAGKATIRWSTSEEGPRRKGSEIVLPLTETAEFLPLKKGVQFLYREEPGHRFHFGGTDENPFLAELDGTVVEAVSAIGKKGEDVFYDFLKPDRVKFLEEVTGEPAPRQGDIFAPRIGWGWKDIRAFASVTGLLLHGDEEKKGEVRVFGTRHVLKGRCLQAEVYELKWGWDRTLAGIKKITQTLFATGVLEAPDHSPIQLEGIHVLHQVEVLYRPREAD